MDLLTDLLRQAGLRRRLLGLSRLADPAALRFPCDRSIGLHLVLQGRLYVHGDALAEPLVLEAGDVALMARGCHHVLSTRSSLQGVPVRTVDSGDAGPPASPPESGALAVSGAYQLWNAPVHPFFGQMPAFFVLGADSLPRLGPVALGLGLLEQELRRPQLGAESVLHGLLDVVFTYVLREVVQRADGTSGWSQALLDAPVRRALDALHHDCAHAWTLDELAVQAGMSRTRLAERFRVALGETPLAYLRTVRMQNAVRLLTETERNLEQVAAEVGYQDAFSFSKVFKRTLGVSPREFRQRNAQERSDPHRILTPPAVLTSA